MRIILKDYATQLFKINDVMNIVFNEGKKIILTVAL